VTLAQLHHSCNAKK